MSMKIKDRLLGLWNIWPPFLGAGISITKRSSDYRYMRVEMPLRFYNANFVGTQYGGSMFSMTDPFYMVMLLKNLGKEYIVWDKSASIRYLKPGKTRVHVEFHLTEELLENIKATVAENEKVDWPFTAKIKDINNEVVAEVEKILYIRKKR